MFSTIPTVPPTTIVVGDRRVIPLVDAVGPGLVAAEVYPHVAPAELTALLDADGDDYTDPTRTRLRMAVQGFLVLGGGRTILVDTCLGGPKPNRTSPLPGFVSQWMTTLAGAGVAPEAVDTVVTTHLHHDHVGWNTTLTASGQLRPTFPHARYLLVRDDHEYFTGPQGRPALERRGDYVADSIQPVADAGLLDLVPATHHVDDDVRLVPAPGHTPGHVVVEIASRGRTAVLAADLIHHPLQLRRPDISAVMCVDQATAAASRRHILDRYADTDAYFLASHLPYAGYVRRQGDGYALTRLPGSGS
jgi:glyoxylase-like metal-dependent hydrolase (beta-lactamase superfamily II)